MHSLLFDVAVLSPAKLLNLYIRVSFALLITLIFLAAWKYRNFTKKYAGFPAYPLLTTIIYTYALRKFPSHLPLTSWAFQKVESIVKQFQHEGLCIVWLAKPILFLFGEEAVKIFSKEQAAVDKSYHYEVIGDGFGTGLLTSNGEKWRKHRKLLNPVFHVAPLKTKLAIFNENAEILVKRLSSAVDKTSLDIHKFLKCTTFDILCESIMGFKVNTPENKAFRRRFLEIVEKLSGVITYRFLHPWLHYKFMLHFIPSGRKFLDMFEEGHNMLEKFVLDMKNSVLASKCNKEDLENSNRKSFTHVLIEHHLKNPSFTLQDVQDQVATFMAGGYDTVSSALLWCLFLLGHHPDVQEQVYNEFENLSEKCVTFEDLYELKYLECVIKETLRLYTPVPLHARRINKDIQCDKYLVPRGTVIVFFPYMLHRDPTIYPDPEKFDPERFQEGNSEKRPWIHTPFSEGIRNCIGKKFAMMEMMVILTHILRNFKVTSLESMESVNLDWKIVMEPTKPLHVKLTSRNE